MPRLTVHPRGAVVEVKKGAALVDVADEHELGLDFGCRDGVCGTCIMTVRAGAENLSSPDVEERDTLENFDAAPGQRLACQVKIRGDVEIEVIEG
jgi:ferredoxin